MPKTAKGRKIMRSMTKTYGSKKKAQQVFYASANAKRIKGVEKKRSRRRRK